MTSPTAPEPTLVNGNGHNHHSPNTEIEKLLNQIAALSQDKDELERKRYVDANLARFAEIMRWRVEFTLETWADQLLMELVPFVGGLHASFYVLFEAQDAAERNLTWIGGYACPEDVKKTIPVGSGLTGQVGKTGEPIYLDDPNTFQSNTYSSLSTLRSQAFLIQPLVHNEVVEGVLEITALQAFKPEQRELIEILCGQLAANLSTIKNQVRIQKLYQEAQEKSEMLAAQEEEMRQNVEELEATQEEMRRIQQNIEVQRKQLASIISSTNDFIVAIDTNHQVMEYNEAHARLFEAYGITEERGMHYSALTGPDQWPAIKSLWDRALGGESFVDEMEFTLGGQTRYYSVAYNPIKVNNTVVGACYFAKDISEAREAQEMMKQANEEMAAQGEELRQNLEELEATQEEMRRTQAMAQEQKAQIDALLDSSDDVIVMVDTDFRLVIANKKVRDNYRLNAGIDPEPGMSVFQLFPPEQLEYYKALYDRALAGENFVEPVHFVGMGMEFFFEVSYFPVQFLGRTIGAASMARDVTTAKQAEAEMNALQARLGQVAANAPGFIFQLTINPETLDTRFTYASPRSQEMFGYTPEFFYGLSFEQALQLVHPLDQVSFRQSFIGGVQMGDQIVWEGRMVHHEGQILHIRMEANSTPNDDGTLSANGMIVDIADEIALRHRQTLQELGLNRLAKSTTIASGQFDKALEEMTRVLSESLEAQMAGVWFLQKRETAMLSIKVYDSATAEYSEGMELLEADYKPYFDAVRTGEVIVAHDAHTHPATACFGESYLKEYGVGALLDVPVRRAGKLLGVICIEHVGPARTWTDDEIRFAANVAELITLALEARERQELMAEMDSQRAKIEGLLDASTDIILLLDEEYRLALMNKAMRSAFTIDGREPALGDDVFNYLPPTDHTTYLERYKRAFAGESFSVENQYEYLGITMTQEIKHFPIREGDEIKFIAIVATDISERKQQEVRIQQAHAEQLAQQAKIQGLINNNSDMIIMLDRDLNVVLLNQAMRYALQATGMPAELGTNVLTYVDPTQHEETKGFYKRAFAGETFEVENTYETAQGSAMFAVRYFPIYENDKVEFVATVTSDISLRKAQEAQIRQANEELQAQEEELRQNLEEMEATQEEMRRTQRIAEEQHALLTAMLDSSEDSVVICDPAYKILMANQRVVDAFKANAGIDVQVGMSVLDLCPPDQLKEYQALYDRALRGESFDVPLNYQAHGVDLHIVVSYYPVYQGKQIIGVASISKDVTAARQAEAALREAQEKMSQVEQNLPGVLYQFWFDKTDGSAGFNFVSQQVESMYGFTKDEWLAFGIAEIANLFHPDSLEEFQTKLMAAVMELKPFQMNCKARRKDGSYFWATIEARTRDIGHNKTLSEGIIVDASQQVELLQKSQTQSAQFSSLINSTTDTILMLDRSYHIIMMNEQMRNSYAAQGIEANIGDDVFGYLPPEQHDWYRSNYERALAGENFTVDVHYEYMGMNIYYSINMYPVQQEDATVGIAIVARDVTTLKTQQQDLELKDSLFANWEEPIWVFDQGKVTDVNAASVKLFKGKSREDFVGKTPDVLSPATQPDGRSSDAAAREYISQAIQNGKASFEWMHQDLKGKQLPCTVTLRTFPYADRQVIAAILTPKTVTKK